MNKYAIVGALFAVACGASNAGAEMRIYTHDGQVLTVPVERDNIKHIEYTDTRRHRPPARSQSYRVFYAVPKRDSKAFKANKEDRLAVDTTRYDQTPYYLTTPFKKELYLEGNQRCYLSGSDSGSAGWSVDNFLFIEILSREGAQRFVVGSTDAVSYKGRPVGRLGRDSVSFGAGEIDLTPYIPRQTNVTVRISALDYGGVGYVSDLFLVVQ